MARPRLVRVVLVGAAVFSNANAAIARPADATTLHLYTPFSVTGVAKGVSIARETSGHCWTTSLTDPRSDAFRCFTGNRIHDPCFARDLGRARFVLCPLSQPGSKVVRVDLTKKLPRTKAVPDPTHRPPWSVRLANGRWCEMIAGASGLVAGMRISYGCTGGGTLLGVPDRAADVWTIFYAASFDSGSFTSVGIASAWW